MATKKAAGSKKTKTKVKKQPETMTPSESVETPLTVWLATDIRGLTPNQYARLANAITEAVGVAVVSVSVHPDLQEIN